ncbi:MAG: hypothetical protein D8M59_12745 [Planctomycetes bacterium]|nr:hypothetical protein [Planctomycetota bacterium]NOG53686.1 hypothetical protein [Planctomycetota bacterium]
MPCPECGRRLPFALTGTRRWARLRLPWDRSSRRGLIRPYLSSLWWITFRPRAAARGLAIPDHWGRAIRWAIAHLLLAMAVGVGIPLLTEGTDWLLQDSPPFWKLVLVEDWVIPDIDVITHALLTLPIWLLCIVPAPLASAICSLVSTNGGRAARLGRIKWLLYCTALIPPLLAVCTVTVTILASATVEMPLNYLARLDVRLGPPVFMLIVFLLYSVPWALGHMNNPYSRKRSDWFGTILYFVAATYVWMAYLVPLGALDKLMPWPFGDW